MQNDPPTLQRTESSEEVKGEASSIVDGQKPGTSVASANQVGGGNKTRRGKR